MRYGKPWILFLTAALLLVALLLWRQEPQIQLHMEQEAAPISFQVHGEGKTEQIRCWEQNGRYYLFLPSFAKPGQTQLKLDGIREVLLDGAAMENGRICETLTEGKRHSLEYTQNGERITGELVVLGGSSIPSVHIRVQSGSMDYIHEEKGNTESGSIHIYNADGSTSFSGNLKSINGRGNGTWTSEKKSYSLSLAGEADLLDMGSAQKWILLANDGDPSHLRNKLVYDFARQAGLAGSPESRWVDLYLNGEYAGLYQLCERNEIHPQRIDLPENSSFLVSLELEKRLVEQQIPYVTTDSGRALRIHHSSLETESLESLWQSVENAIFAEDGLDPVTGKHWETLIDLDSWARKYLVEELFGNGDAGGLSQFFYGDTETGKLYAGPVWDFDISMGSDGIWQQMRPQAFFANRERLYRGMDSSWYHALWEKEAFSQRVVQLYRETFRPLLEIYLQENLPDYAQQIHGAAQRNQLRWGRGSAEEAAKQIETYMDQRLEFLDSIWLEGETWYTVLVDINDGSNIACYAVRPGDALPQLPDITGVYDAEGWYHRGTEQAVDISQPVTENLDLYCRRKIWEEPEESSEDPGVTAPAAAFLALFLTAAGWEWVRQRASGRKGKRTENHQN